MSRRFDRYACLWAVVAALAAGAGCGGGDGDGGGGPDGGGDGGGSDAAPRSDAGEDGGGCAPAEMLARFWIQSSPEHGSLTGSVYDRPDPLALTPMVSGGGCAFYGYEPVLCDPPCQGGMVCGAGGTCVPYRVTIPAGTVRVTGTNPELELEPSPGGSYYTMESYPGLLPAGAEAVLAGGGQGSDVEPFELRARGVPPLVINWESVQAVEHQDMVIEWNTDEASPEGAQVVLHMDNDHHGIPAYVECWADDTGSLTVPADVLDPLIEAGETGIGTYIENAWLARRYRGTAPMASGCAVLDAESMTWINVETIRAR